MSMYSTGMLQRLFRTISWTWCWLLAAITVANRASATTVALAGVFSAIRQLLRVVTRARACPDAYAVSGKLGQDECAGV